MKLATFNLAFLIAGITGMPMCLYGWRRWHHKLWLIGVGLFAYFLVSSLRDLLMKPRTR